MQWARDEGGSSCIYLKKFGGIVNSPSDNAGEERPTYTHFGIHLRERQIRVRRNNRNEKAIKDAKNEA